MTGLRALRAHLNERLFLEAPRAARPLGRGEAAIVLLSLFAIAVVLQLLRLGWSDSLDTLWAEDGTIFLQGALTHGFLDNVTATYAGYLVLVPRLIGEGAAIVPLRDAAAATAILSAAVVALSGFAVWWATGGILRNPCLRGSLAFLTVLAPVAGQESIDSAAYVPWYMLFATFWLLLWRPRTLWGAGLAGLFVLATGLSTPGVWFFFPLAALRALAARDRRDLAVVGSYGLGAAVQLPIVAFNTEEKVEPAWTHEIWTAFLQRALDGAALGLRLGGSAWSHLGWPLLIALLVAAAVGVAFGFRRGTPAVRWLLAICVLTSLALFVVSVYQRAVGPQIVWPAGNYDGAAGRYAIVPALLLVSAGLAIVDSALRRRSSPAGARWLTLGVVAVLALGVVTSFDMRSSARATPKWRASVTEASAACSRPGATEVTIPITPLGWAMTVPCEELADVQG
jgi:hypothetical protein